MQNKLLPNRLESLITEAKKSGWCTQAFCTTCGSTEFRDRLRAMNRDKLLADLRLLKADFVSQNQEAIRVVYLDIRLLPTGADLNDRLEGSPAGDLLRETQMHAQARAAERDEHAMFNSPEAVMIRRKAKLDSSRQKLDERATKRDRANTVRLKILKSLSSLSMLDRLRAIVAQDFPFSIDAVPPEILEGVTPDILSQLSRSDLDALMVKIDKRKGSWAKIAREISKLTKGDPHGSDS